MKKPPFTRVRLFGKTVTIDWNADVTDDCFGRYAYAENRVEINKDQGPDQMRDTVLHELLHGVAYEMGLKVPEKHIRLLATGLLALLRDNPKLVAYLTGENA